MAVDMFLKMTNITGESQDKVHADEIDVLAWSWGASQSGTTHSGAGGGSGKASFQDLSITKYVDKSSPTLLASVATGKHFDDVLLTVRKAGATPVEYIKLAMKEVIITSLSTGGSGGEDRLTENISLNFAEYEFTYTPQTKTGGEGTKVISKFDIAKNAVP